MPPCALNNLAIRVCVYGGGKTQHSSVYQCHSKDTPLYYQCLSVKDYQEPTVVEPVGLTVHCNEGEHTPQGIMGHLSKKVSERTYSTGFMLCDLKKHSRMLLMNLT